MSRIDEALRRAADRQAFGHRAAEPRPAASGDSGRIEPFPGEHPEPFPAEYPERFPAENPEPFPFEASNPRNDGAEASEPASEPALDSFPLEAAEQASEPVASLDLRPEVSPPPSPGARPAGPATTDLGEQLDEALAEKVVADARMAALPREQYRRLAAVLHDLQSGRSLSVLMVASAVPAEGKTLTATNLALTLSESYQDRVLLIDADLRRPALHDVFGLTVGTGLLQGLDPNSATKLVVRQVTPRLSVLTAGGPTSDPMAALTSPRMKQLIAEAKETFDWVILDTPPLLLLPDAHLLSGLVDGAVLVVKANSTAHDSVRRAADIIGRERITGVVLNSVKTGEQAAYVHYRYDYLARSAETGA